MDDILSEASGLINGDRAASYGTVSNNWGCIAAKWTCSLQAAGVLKEGAKITPRMALMLMVDVKSSRDMFNPKRDNVLDIAGYAGCIDKLEKGL